VRLTLGATASYDTLRVAVPVFPPPSVAVTVSTLTPGCSGIPAAVQLVVPTAVPLPPPLRVHDTRLTPSALDAVPPSVSELLFVL